MIELKVLLCFIVLSFMGIYLSQFNNQFLLLSMVSTSGMLAISADYSFRKN